MTRVLGILNGQGEGGTYLGKNVLAAALLGKAGGSRDKARQAVTLLAGVATPGHAPLRRGLPVLAGPRRHPHLVEPRGHAARLGGRPLLPLGDGALDAGPLRPRGPGAAAAEQRSRAHPEGRQQQPRLRLRHGGRARVIAGALSMIALILRAARGLGSAQGAGGPDGTRRRLVCEGTSRTCPWPPPWAEGTADVPGAAGGRAHGSCLLPKNTSPHALRQRPPSAGSVGRCLRLLPSAMKSTDTRRAHDEQSQRDIRIATWQPRTTCPGSRAPGSRRAPAAPEVDDFSDLDPAPIRDARWIRRRRAVRRWAIPALPASARCRRGRRSRRGDIEAITSWGTMGQLVQPRLTLSSLEVDDPASPELAVPGEPDGMAGRPRAPAEPSAHRGRRGLPARSRKARRPILHARA